MPESGANDRSTETPSSEAIYAAICHRCRKQKRQFLASLVSFFVLQLGTNGRYHSTIPRGLFSFSSLLGGTPPLFFTRLYGIPHPVFMALSDKLDLEDKKTFRRSCPLLRLSVTIRWLARGSHLDISLAHGISTSTLCNYVEDTRDLLDQFLLITFPYGNETWLKDNSEGFSRGGRSALKMCCGALDGISIKIKEPHAWEVQLCFLSFCCSTYDSTAYSITGLAHLLTKQDEGLLAGFWIAADNAYKCINRLLTPWPGRNVSISKDFFNWWKSFARIFIEQAFGILVSRWGILWRPLSCTLQQNAKAVVVCCKLHNSIIDRNGGVQVPPISDMDTNHHTEEADGHVYLQHDCDLDESLHRRRRDLDSSQLCEECTEEIEASCRRRP